MEILPVHGLETTSYYSLQPQTADLFNPEKVRPLGGIFTAFGNHEAKALALLSLGLEDAVTKHQLRSALGRFTGYAWDLHHDSVESYLKTLKKFGGFTVPEPSPKGKKRWRLTTAGITSLPVAAYILIESYRHLIPLEAALGSSNSRYEQHAPLNSLLVLADMIANGGSTSISKVVKDTGINYNAADLNILRLSRSGLINHESLTPEKGKGTINYSIAKEVKEEEIPGFKGKADYMVIAFYRIVRQRGAPMNVDDVVSIVKNDQSVDPRLKRLKGLRTVVNNVLGALRRAGILQSNLTAVTDQSKISFKDDNYLEEFIRSVVPAVGAYLDGDPLMRQKFELAHSFLVSSSEEAKFIREYLMNKARSASYHSPEAVRPLSARISDVYDYLLSHPHSRPADIAKAVEFSVPEVIHVLYQLTVSGEVSRIRAGRGSYYSIIEVPQL